MPTIIDSLFLELGIDTSKFSKDQSKSLDLIHKFETQAKKSAKTVRGAFSELFSGTRVGSSASHLDDLAKKLNALGLSARVSGGAATPFGLIAQGAGMMLSPLTLGVAAVGLLGKGMWDLNKAMTTANSTLVRQSQLSSMNADNLWAWGQAAKVVGANPNDITGGISSVQQAIGGMMIGAGDATPQLVALARLGLGLDTQSGMSDAQVTQMFSRVHSLAAAKGYKNLGGLRSLTGPIMNDAMFALASSPNFDPGTMQGQIKAMEPANLGAILQESLKSQEVLGKLGIRGDILKETAYGGEQGLMQAMVQLLTGILTGVTKLADFIIPSSDSWLSSKLGGAAASVGDFFTRGKKSAYSGMSSAMQALVGAGIDPSTAAAMVGNMMQESGMDPFARNPSGHVGIMQWDATRQGAFANWAGYQMGSGSVPRDRQFRDQVAFAVQELQGSHRSAAAQMALAQDLMGKTSAFMRFDEIVNDSSFAQRLGYAREALQLSGGRGGSSSTVSNDIRIDGVHVHTPATDPASHAEAVRKGLKDSPLLDLSSQGFTALATRGSQ